MKDHTKHNLSWRHQSDPCKRYAVIHTKYTYLQLELYMFCTLHRKANMRYCREVVLDLGLHKMCKYLDWSHMKDMENYTMYSHFPKVSDRLRMMYIELLRFHRLHMYHHMLSIAFH